MTTPHLAEMLGIVLRSEGFDAHFCADGRNALAAFRDVRPDVVLLDVMLPGRDGIAVCRDIRAESGVPIVMLTARTDTLDIVAGLESGADDYIVKPFKPKELVARVRARLRRFDPQSPELLMIGDLTIDVAGHSVSRDGKRGQSHAAGVRPARMSGALAAPSVLARRAAREGVGLQARGRHPFGQRARSAPSFEDRTRS